MSATNIEYYYDITLASKKNIYLTSNEKVTFYQGRKYYPYSRLYMIEGNFNDSADDVVKIGGIFEDQAIASSSAILGATFRIMIHNLNKYPIHMYCVNVTAYDTHFELELNSEMVQYGRSLLEVFSINCRASFGDKKCGVDVAQYEKQVKIVEIHSKYIIFIEDKEIPNHYFSEGYIMVVNNSHSRYNIKILEQCINHYNKQQLLLSEAVDDIFTHGDIIHLIPSCDKTFLSCCNKYNNHLNFRGEPFIPNK